MVRLISICLIMITAFTFNHESTQNKYSFHGKYGLYIKEIDQNWEINWRTTAQEKGELFVYEKDTKIAEYHTENSIIHRVSIPVTTTIADIKFGGESSGTTTVKLDPNPKRHPTEIQNVDSIYALGDVHGHFDETVSILKNSGLIDAELHWTGGSAHLVFVGDVLDRGNDATRLMWFIYELEKEAASAGGGVHLVLGNHEIMVMSNDLRYVTPKEKQIASFYQVSYNQMFNPRETVLGKWLAGKPGIFKIDGVIFAHGGVITDYGSHSAQTFNDSVYKFIQEPVFTHLMDDKPDTLAYSRAKWSERRGFFFDSNSPFWYRDYVQSDSLNLYLAFILSKHKAKIHVVGHTRGPSIQSKYKGKLIATNVDKFGTEMLLLVRNKKKYRRYKIDLDGNVAKLDLVTK